MLRHELLQEKGILIIRPEAPLEAADFQKVARQIDPHIEANGKLHGVMIDAESFAGWDDCAAIMAHFKFVRDHQKNIERIAIVTDAGSLSFASRIVSHFVRAEVRQFPCSLKNEAMTWLAAGNTQPTTNHPPPTQ